MVVTSTTVPAGCSQSLCQFPVVLFVVHQPQFSNELPRCPFTTWAPRDAFLLHCSVSAWQTCSPYHTEITAPVARLPFMSSVTVVYYWHRAVSMQHSSVKRRKAHVRVWKSSHRLRWVRQTRLWVLPQGLREAWTFRGAACIHHHNKEVPAACLSNGC